jgi:hypothetical protein
MAFDNRSYEKRLFAGFDRLVAAGIRPEQIRIFVLIGFNDDPEDALYRLEKIRSMGAIPNPMRYQPINTMVKNKYMGANWDRKTLLRIMRYYARLAYWENIPFNEWQPNIRKPRNEKTHR